MARSAASRGRRVFDAAGLAPDEQRPEREAVRAGAVALVEGDAGGDRQADARVGREGGGLAAFAGVEVDAAAQLGRRAGWPSSCRHVREVERDHVRPARLDHRQVGERGAARSSSSAAAVSAAERGLVVSGPCLHDTAWIPPIMKRAEGRRRANATAGAAGEIRGADHRWGVRVAGGGPRRAHLAGGRPHAQPRPSGPRGHGRRGLQRPRRAWRPPAPSPA